MGSPVFDTMFNGSTSNFLEIVSIETPDGVKMVHKVPISDVSPEAFKIMLRFLYLDEISLDDETVVDTVYCGRNSADIYFP